MAVIEIIPHLKTRIGEPAPAYRSVVHGLKAEPAVLALLDKVPGHEAAQHLSVAVLNVPESRFYVYLVLFFITLYDVYI